VFQNLKGKYHLQNICCSTFVVVREIWPICGQYEIQYTELGMNFDVHESMHRDTTMKITNKMHYIDYYSKSVLHVSGDVLAHHQEHLTVFIVSDSVHPSC